MSQKQQSINPLLVAVGFNVETVTYKNLKFQVWDLGGQTGLRPYWRCYYQDTNAVIFVVDSADKERIEIAKQELELMLQEEELKGVPVLVLANKQDLPNALNDQEVAGTISSYLYRYAMAWDSHQSRIDRGACSRFLL